VADIVRTSSRRRGAWDHFKSARTCGFLLRFGTEYQVCSRGFNSRATNVAAAVVTQSGKWPMMSFEPGRFGGRGWWKRRALSPLNACDKTHTRALRIVNEGDHWDGYVTSALRVCIDVIPGKLTGSLEKGSYRLACDLFKRFLGFPFRRFVLDDVVIGWMRVVGSLRRSEESTRIFHSARGMVRCYVSSCVCRKEKAQEKRCQPCPRTFFRTSQPVSSKLCDVLFNDMTREKHSLGLKTVARLTLGSHG